MSDQLRFRWSHDGNELFMVGREAGPTKDPILILVQRINNAPHKYFIYGGQSRAFRTFKGLKAEFPLVADDVDNIHPQRYTDEQFEPFRDVTVLAALAICPGEALPEHYAGLDFPTAARAEIERFVAAFRAAAAASQPADPADADPGPAASPESVESEGCGAFSPPAGAADTFPHPGSTASPSDGQPLCDDNLGLRKEEKRRRESEDDLREEERHQRLRQAVPLPPSPPPPPLLPPVPIVPPVPHLPPALLLPPPPPLPAPAPMVVRLSPRMATLLFNLPIRAGDSDLDDHTFLREICFSFSGRGGRAAHAALTASSSGRCTETPEFSAVHCSPAGVLTPFEGLAQGGIRGGFGVVRLSGRVAVKIISITDDLTPFDRWTAAHFSAQGPVNPFVVPMRVLWSNVTIEGTVWDALGMIRMDGVLSDFTVDLRKQNITKRDLGRILRELLRGVRSLLAQDFCWADAKTGNVLFSRVGVDSLRLYFGDPGSMVPVRYARDAPLTYGSPFPRSTESDAAWGIVVVCLGLTFSELSGRTVSGLPKRKHLRSSRDFPDAYGNLFVSFNRSEQHRCRDPSGVLAASHDFLSRVFYQGSSVHFCTSELTFDQIEQALQGTFGAP